ncbi:MAG TPA: PilZ domain-containing protein [Polyangiaceae bacterium]|nr:PilZ domain-containing protein [Polyangiaceae bacterium]
MDEKRSHARYTLWFPVTVDAVSRQVWAVCRDASAGGILLTCSQGLRVGQEVTITFRVSPESPVRRILGRIVRTEAPDDNPWSVWPYRMAIEFVEPDETLQSMFARLSSRPPPPPAPFAPPG